MSFRVCSIGLMLLLVGAAGCTPTGRKDLLAPIRKESNPGSQPASDTESEEADTTRPQREPYIAQRPHDPATRRLIETELLDASPQEQAELLPYLATLDSQEVSRALSERRRQKRTMGDPTAAPVSQPDSLLADASPPSRLKQGHSLSGDRQGPSLNPLAADDSEQAVVPANRLVNPAESADLGNQIETASGQDHVRKFPSITDWEGRLWPGPRDEETESPEPAAGAAEQRRGGSLFPFPQIKGAKQAEAEPATSARRATVPLVTDTLERKPPTGQLLNPDATVWEEELQKLISLMEADNTSMQPGMSLTEQQEYLRKQITLRMLYLAANHPEQAQQVISGLPAAEQEFWTAVFWGLSDYVDTQATSDPAERATLTISQLRSAIHHLQSKAHLRLTNLTFCDSISSFGNYSAYESDMFSPGQTILLYCEVQNFQSELTSAGDYRTLLKSTVEIYREGTVQELVDRNSFAATEDLSRTQRSDYFHSYRVDLPDHLTPGPYTLKLTVEDQLNRKIHNEMIPFHIR